MQNQIVLVVGNLVGLQQVAGLEVGVKCNYALFLLWLNVDFECRLQQLLERCEFLCDFKSRIRFILLNVHEEAGCILHGIDRIEISVVILTIDQAALVVLTIIQYRLALWVFFF